jgi:5-methylthioribose kinase
MFDLTPQSALAYLRRRGIEAAHVGELAEGVSNVVLRVETPSGCFVLKQSRPQLRTRDPWFSDIDRIWRERDAMVLLRPLLPASAVPAVLWSDEANYALAMSHAPEPFRNWRSVLLAGEVDLALGERAGRLLSAIHASTARNREALRPFEDCTVFEQLRIEPFYLRVQHRRPEFAPLLQPLIERCRSPALGLCHGDFSPKNLLLHADGFTLVDYETCHAGDIAFDLGFFLSHLILKAVYVAHRREALADLTRAFWRGYEAGAGASLPGDLKAAGMAHMAGCLLARVDGASPAPYLTDEGLRDLVRRMARRLLQQQPRDWEDVLLYLREAVS